MSPVGTGGQGGRLEGADSHGEASRWFCLWPTATTEHNISKSPYRNGNGDIVRELQTACAEAGLRFGLYCSPWDRNHGEYGSPAYVEAFHAQWRELCSNYGPLFELWLDGANGGDGFYGGARETRSIDAKNYYRYDDLVAMFRELQPEAVINGGTHSDLRWCGNEHGFCGITNWACLDAEETLDQSVRQDERLSGKPDGQTWRPIEVDLSIRRGWFWHEREAPHTAETLFQVWLASVGRGAGMLLNLAPDRRGLIPSEDIRTLTEFGHRVAAFEAEDLAVGRPISYADAHGAENPTVDASALLDHSTDTSWIAPDQDFSLTISLCDEGNYRVHRLDGMRLEEDIRYGQHIAGWVIEARTWGSWLEVARGTTIGAQRIIRFDATSGDAVRLRILESTRPPALRRIKVYAGINHLH